MIDVIIPAYNCEGTLKNTVISIEKSGLKKFNIIIVDDGSVDSTKAVCDELMGLYENVSCLFKSNGGVSSARNAGLKKASGEYVLFFDSDDTVDEGAFSDIETLLSENMPDMLIFGMYFDFYKNGRLYRTDSLVCEKEGLFEKKELLEDFCALYDVNVFTSSCNKFIRKSIITENAVGYNEDMIILEDLLFSLKVLEKCKTVYCLKKPIYRYRQPENQKRIIERMAKVPPASEYIKPFEAEIDSLCEGISQGSKAYSECREVLEKLYLMIVRQKCFSAELKTIKEISKDFVKSPLCSSYKKLPKDEQVLFCLLENGNALKVAIFDKKIRFKKSIIRFSKRIGVYDKIKEVF